MARKILILNGHPDPSGKGLVPALASAYAAAATEAGHEVRRIDVATLQFGFVRSQAEFEHAPAPPDIAAAQQAILWADHVVVVFPLWLGDQPAVLKAFFEQTLRPGFAYAYRPSGFPEAFLKGRSARIIVTMGMPALVYRWYFRAHGLKNLKRNILKFVGFSPVRDTLLGSVGTRSKEAIAQWFEDLKALGRRAA
ncbi:MAG: NAD(P)H-dependent oxidoreductase [Reyranellales bacterium]